MGDQLRRLAFVVAMTAGLVSGTVLPANAAEGVHTRSVSGAYADIRERVVMALENRGLTLNYTARVGAMLDRTGKDLGRGKKIYGDAEVLEFCSARLSRDTMEADPHNIAFCPYSIAVYTLAHAPRTVYVSFRSPAGGGQGASGGALKAVERLLNEVVSEALR